MYKCTTNVSFWVLWRELLASDVTTLSTQNLMLNDIYSLGQFTIQVINRIGFPAYIETTATLKNALFSHNYFKIGCSFGNASNNGTVSVSG